MQIKLVHGVTIKQTSDFAVMLPFKIASQNHHDQLTFSRWLTRPTCWLPMICLLILIPSVSLAESDYKLLDALAALWKWLPLIVTQGFVLNVLISILTMAIGTAAGLILGLGQVSPLKPLRYCSICFTQIFRNSPWLVLLFIVMLSLPFEIQIGHLQISIPDWVKAVFGLSLPIMANIAEIVRGAIQSVPYGQWEAAESLGYRRHQTLWLIILPQCFKRMIPPWMNWYAILTMATPLVSLLGVEEVITLSRQAMGSEDDHPELLIPFYGFALMLFFIYCYPIARLTIRLEKRFAVQYI